MSGARFENQTNLSFLSIEASSGLLETILYPLCIHLDAMVLKCCDQNENVASLDAKMCPTHRSITGIQLVD